MLNRSVARAVLNNRRVRRHIGPHSLNLLVPDRMNIRFLTRHLHIGATLRRTMSLNRLFTFRLSPTLLLRMVRHFSRSVTLNQVLLMRHVRVRHHPNPHTHENLGSHHSGIFTLTFGAHGRHLQFLRVFRAMFNMVNMAQNSSYTRFRLRRRNL